MATSVPAQTGPAAPSEKVMLTIARGLAAKPAYLLLFGMSFLMGGGGVGVLINGLLARDRDAQVIGGGLFVVAIISVLVAIYIVDRAPREAPAVAASTDSSRHTTSDARIDAAAAALMGSLAQASQHSDPLFRELIRNEIVRFSALATQWTRGIFSTDDEAEGLTIRFYRGAQSRVFSTSVPEYLQLWSTTTGQLILDAHEEAFAETGAVVTRLFIFKDRSSLTTETLELLRSQDRLKSVAVRLLFTDELGYDPFPPNIGNDFTVIDEGRVIGLTASFLGRAPQSLWHFSDEDLGITIRALQQELTKNSIALREYE